MTTNSLDGLPPTSRAPYTSAEAITPSDSEEIEHLPRGVFVGSGGALTVVLAEDSFVEIPAVKATAAVTVTNDGATPLNILAGNLTVSDGAHAFASTEDIVDLAPSATVDVAVEATVAGAAGNVDPAAIDTVDTAPAGVDVSVTNAAPTTGGAAAVKATGTITVTNTGVDPIDIDAGDLTVSDGTHLFVTTDDIVALAADDSVDVAIEASLAIAFCAAS